MVRGSYSPETPDSMLANISKKKRTMADRQDVLPVNGTPYTQIIECGKLYKNPDI
jgi:hypothetical protein